MKNVEKKETLNITEKYLLNIKINNGTLDILLGHNKYILNYYNRNFVKLIGGWYHENITINTNYLATIIEKYKIKKVNFIGASKSCSGCIVLTKGLLEKKFPSLKFKLFLFSAYTTIDKNVYVKRRIEGKAPASLKSVWNSKFYTENLIRKMEMRRLINVKNVMIYLFYPCKSNQGEKILANRIQGNNIHHIDIPVYMHNTLYPFWKKVGSDRTIELYENEFKIMHKNDYAFYSSMQEYKGYAFNLYTCIENPTKFIEEFNHFKLLYKDDYK